MSAPDVRPGFGDAVAAEYLKIVTIRSTWWFAGGLVAILLAMALLDEGAVQPGSSGWLTTAAAATGNFGQHVVAAFGLLVITGELATRSITVTFAATPPRGRVLAAKAAVAALAAAAMGVVASGAGIVLGAARAGELSRVDGAAAEQVAATGVYLGLLAVVALGVGVLVRRTAGALTVMILLLVLVPELLRLASERYGIAVLGTLSDWSPAPAGFRLMTGSWEYALGLAAWAAALLMVATAVLRRRDA